MDYLLSYFAVAVSTASLFLPVWLLFPLFPRVSRNSLLLATMGMYVTLAYLKPAGLPLWALPFAVIFVSVILRNIRTIERKGFWVPLKSPPVWGILVYSFLLFFFRWEPPGDDPTKWGALARLFEMSGVIPGNLNPLSPIADLKGANMGIPVPLAIAHLGNLAGMERLVSFFSCLSLALFTFSVANGLRHWFSERTSQWSALIGLILFTNPQSFLSWGGTPTLLGLTGGFTLLEWVDGWKTPRKHSFENLIFALAIAFAAHAHAVGIYLSVLVFVPFVAGIVLCSNEKGVGIRRGILFGILVGVIFSPFLLHWGMNATSAELAEAWLWQKRMAPFMFRPDHGALANLVKQVSAYTWETALYLCTAILAFVFVKDRKAPFLKPALILILLITGLIYNVCFWKLPLSFLIYPERAATLFIFPLCCFFAWLIDYLREGQTKPVLRFGFLAAVTIFGFHQFTHRLYPFLGTSALTAPDRRVINQLAQSVPQEDCIEISPGSPGMWIGAMAFRCHYPRHPFGFNTVEEDRRKPTQGLAWRFYSAAESLVEAPGRVVLNNKARLIKN